MAFITDKEELKPGLIIFRRADVEHDNWYCRVKLPKQDRYKTVSLKTGDRTAAREAAFKEDYRVQFSLEKNLPIFNRSFAEVGQEYAKFQKQQATAGQISERRAAAVRGIIEGHLKRYVGNAQVQLVGHELWDNYPVWRRSVGHGDSDFRAGSSDRHLWQGARLCSVAGTDTAPEVHRRQTEARRDALALSEQVEI